MRQVCLDTETTGLAGHDQIVEVGAVELVDRRIGSTFHQFVKPTVPITDGARAVHGLTDEMLSDKPSFREITDSLLGFLSGADEVLIHNAPFDLRFLENEIPGFGSRFAISCTLRMAREVRPGRKNSLTALATHYEIPDARGVHSALEDAKLLAQVYLFMSTGQNVMAYHRARPVPAPPAPLALAERRQSIVYTATEEERRLHAEFCRANGIVVF